jgi:hypothetical protein
VTEYKVRRIDGSGTDEIERVCNGGTWPATAGGSSAPRRLRPVRSRSTCGYSSSGRRETLRLMAESEQDGAAKRRALEMRIGGKSYAEIADELGVDIETARRYFDDALRESSDPVDVARRLERLRLYRMLLAVWLDAIAGKPEAMRTGIEIMNRHAALVGYESAPDLEGVDPTVQRFLHVVAHGLLIDAVRPTLGGDD